MTRPSLSRRAPGDQRGQTLVEFSFGLIVFTMLFIGIVDLGRGAFMFNGVSEAARELARETSVHPGTSGLGTSPETAAVLGTQRRLVPGLGTPTYACFDIAGVLQFDTCQPGDWVRVSVSTTFRPAIPFLAGLGPFVFSSSSSAEIQ